MATTVIKNIDWAIAWDEAAQRQGLSPRRRSRVRRQPDQLHRSGL
ncbi:MAG: hypothetical protein WDO24_28385 [Pseudomonadota bacterium]